MSNKEIKKILKVIKEEASSLLGIKDELYINRIIIFCLSEREGCKSQLWRVEASREEAIEIWDELAPLRSVLRFLISNMEYECDVQPMLAGYTRAGFSLRLNEILKYLKQECIMKKISL